MSSRAKKIFLIFSVVVPFLIYCIIYYAPIIRNAPFREKDFVSLEYKWGTAKQLDNTYNSATGQFKYLDKNDSLISLNIKLNERDIKYLDSIAHVQGFFNLPEVISNKEEDLDNPALLRYVIKFNYLKKSKEVTYFPNFNGNDKMKGAASTLQKEIELTLVDKEANEVEE